jgi:hypothetical protein
MINIELISIIKFAPLLQAVHRAIHPQEMMDLILSHHSSIEAGFMTIVE